MSQGEQKRVTIAMPHRDDFTAECVISLIRMMFSSKHITAPYFARSNGMLELTRTQLLLSDAYECDYCLFVDTDTIFPPHALNQLVAHDKDIVSGVVYMGTYPHSPAVFKRHPQHGLMAHMWEIPNQLFEADAVGAAFLMVKKTVIDKFRDPKIIAEYGSPFAQIENFSEDISFCIRAKALGFQIWVDPTLKLGHNKTLTIWPETYENIKIETQGEDFAKLAIEEPDFAKELGYGCVKG